MKETGRTSSRPDLGEITPVSTTRIRANLTRVKAGAGGTANEPAKREAVASGLRILIPKSAGDYNDN